MGQYSKLNVPMNFKGECAEWNKFDLPTKLAPLFNQGYGIDMETGQIRAKYRSSGWNTPWFYTQSIDSKRCNIDHNVKFENFKYIPPRCLQCWKIVVGPKNFAELMKLKEVEMAMDVPCKCGIEVRDYTAKSYGGYFYTASLDEGRERLEQVQKAMKEHMLPDTPVILKRGCTEFEFECGPSPMWVMPDKYKELDEMIETYVEYAPSVNGRQSKIQKAHVFKKWLVWAHCHGDMSYLPWNGGEPIVGDYVTYNDGSIDDIKHDLALAEAHTMASSNNNAPIDPNQLKHFRDLALDFGKQNNISQDILMKTLDYKQNVIESLDPILTGEVDEQR